METFMMVIEGILICILALIVLYIIVRLTSFAALYSFFQIKELFKRNKEDKKHGR